jgi:hypothetical protein
MGSTHLGRTSQLSTPSRPMRASPKERDSLLAPSRVCCACLLDSSPAAMMSGGQGREEPSNHGRLARW